MKLTEETPIFKLIAEREHEFYLGNIKENIKQQILENQEIVERLKETIEWIDKQLPELSANDKDRYIDFEWLKTHLLSIRDNFERSEFQSILSDAKGIKGDKE